MKVKKKYLRRIILFVAYIIFSQGTAIFCCPTYISYSDDNSPPFFEEQDAEIDSNNNTTQSEQITSASITDDNQEN